MVSVPWMTTAPRHPLSSAPLITAASSNRSPKERDAPGLRRKSTVRSPAAMPAKPGTAARSSGAESAGATPPRGARVMAIVPPSAKTATPDPADSVTGEPLNRPLATDHRSRPDIGGLGASSEERGQAATDRERRVAVGDQGGDKDLAIYLAELQDLQSACRQPPAFIWLVGRKGGLPVAEAWHQLHAVRAGRGEYGGFDEGRGGRAASEPCGQRWHGEPNVLGDQLDEGIDVRHAPGADVPLEELLHAGVADRRLRGSSGAHPLPGARQQAVDRRRADVERLADLGVAEAKHVVEQQCRTLTWRQALQGGDKGKADLFAADDFVLRAHRPGEVVVADRLHPGQLRLGWRERRTRPGRGAVTGRVPACLPCPQHVEADIG